MIGDSGVGKSSILLRFVDDQFNESGMDPTIGVDFKVKMYRLPEQPQPLKLTIWDTAGQERFRTLTCAYYRGAHGIVLVYDVGRRESFEALKSVWLKEVDLYSTYSNAVKLLIGNKIDSDERQVSHEDGLEFAREYNTLFIECSAKTKVGIEQAFDELVSKVLETPTLAEVVLKQQAKPASVTLGNAPSASSSAGGCGC
jgi:Ras-related protein Rab-18